MKIIIIENYQSNKASRIKYDARPVIIKPKGGSKMSSKARGAVSSLFVKIAAYGAMAVVLAGSVGAQESEFELRSLYNLGPALSKVYQVPEGAVSVGAYAEMYYTNYASRDSRDVANAYRMVPIIGYNYSDKIIANAEIEIEHGMASGTSAPGNTSGRGGYVAVEFLYLDFLMSKSFNFRAGSILMPVGLINEIHEPPTFNGVMRPEVEREIIPTTWYDVGMGFHGSLGKLDYRAYIVNGLDVELFTDGSGGIKSMRQRGARASAENFAAVGRADYSLSEALRVGGSLYGGRADQDSIPGAEVGITLGDIHATANFGAVGIKTLLAGTLVSGADKLNAYKNLAAGSNKGIGSVQTGSYLETALDVFALARTRSRQDYLGVFARYEIYDTHAEVPSGFARHPSYDRSALTLGLTYRPDPKVVAKADYTIRNSAATTPKPSDSINVGIGFMF